MIDGDWNIEPLWVSVPDATVREQHKAMEGEVFKSFGVPASILSSEKASHSISNQVDAQYFAEKTQRITAEFGDEINRRLLWGMFIGEQDRMLDYLEAVTSTRCGRPDKPPCNYESGEDHGANQN